MSYIKTLLINIFIILTIKLEKNILLVSIIFSFLLESLYLGSFIKKLAKNIKSVIAKFIVPLTPVDIAFPIRESNMIPIIGISLLTDAAIIAKLNGENVYPIDT